MPGNLVGGRGFPFLHNQDLIIFLGKLAETAKISAQKTVYNIFCTKGIVHFLNMIKSVFLEKW